MQKFLWKPLIAFVLSASVVFQAHADPVGLYGSRTPAIAIDPVRDRGMVVYEYGEKIYGKFVDSSGHGAEGSDFLIFPRDPQSTKKYRDPAIVFKTPQNRFYIVARQSYITHVGGVGDVDSHDGIVVSAYAAGGGHLASTTLYTPGVLRDPFSDGEAHPAIAVDTYDDATCCVNIAWEDVRMPDRILLMRLNPDLGLFDASPRAIVTPAERVNGLSATYNSRRDMFAFAYDGCTASGRACDARMTVLPSIASGGERHLLLPRQLGNLRTPALPSITYVPGTDRYVAAWYWSTSASHGLAATTVSTDASGGLAAATPLFWVQGLLECTPMPVLCGTAPTGAARVVAVGATSRAMIVAPSARNFSQLFAGYVFDTATRSITGTRRFSSSSDYIGSGGVAYSPSGRVVGTWRQDTLAGSVWALGVTP